MGRYFLAIEFDFESLEESIAAGVISRMDDSAFDSIVPDWPVTKYYTDS